MSYSGQLFREFARDVSKDSLAEAYTELHEGLAPDRWIREVVPPRPRRFEPLGVIAEIQYSKATTEPKLHDYHHPFAPEARPTFGRDERGRLRILAGRYVVTTHGIEDREPKAIQSEALPPDPKALVTLGKLDWIKYVRKSSGRDTVGVYEFGATGPWLAHDERGNLHVVRGHYTLEKEESKPMKSVMRANPTNGGAKKKSTMDVAKTVVLSSVIVGGVGVGTGIGLRMAMAKITYFQGKPYHQAGATIAAGVVLSIGAVMAGLPPAVAAGLGVGGAIEGLSQGYVTYLAAREVARVAALTPAQRAAEGLPALTPAVTPPTGTPGASGYPLGAGMPYGYQPHLAHQYAYGGQR